MTTKQKGLRDKPGDELLVDGVPHKVTQGGIIMPVHTGLVQGVGINVSAILQQDEAKESQETLELEEEDFKVDSTNWETYIIGLDKFKVNADGDILEFIKGEFKGQQIFTYYAAIRETKKAGKTIPTIIQWGAIIQKINPSIKLESIWQVDTSVRETLNLGLLGSRVTTDYSEQGSFGYYWIQSPPSVYDYYILCLSSREINPTDRTSSSKHFGVRCLKNKNRFN